MKKLFEWTSLTEEREYFTSKSENLESKIDELRAILKVRRQLGKKIGIDDEVTLMKLQEAGFDQENVEFVFMIPAILIAWEGGSITAEQAGSIEDIINDGNLSDISESYRVLYRLRNECPGDKLSSAALCAIRNRLENSSAIDVQNAKELVNKFGIILGVDLSALKLTGRGKSKTLQTEIEAISGCLNLKSDNCIELI